MTADTHTLIMAAMFAAIPSGLTKISRAGHSIVFSRPVLGRHDLSELREGFALAQAREAGLDIEAVTPEQIEAYQSWYSEMYDARRLADARFLITRKFRLEVGAHSLEPGNRVSLTDGWGNVVASANILCRQQFDSAALNRLGQLGAVVSSPDYEKIHAWIDRTRIAMPEFVAAQVQDNNGG